MLYLASQSPRRRALLHRLGLPFEVVAVDVPEHRAMGEAARDYVARVAREKADAGLSAMRSQPAAHVIGADTEVVLDGEVYGKPRDAADAASMLGRLSGRTHEVISSVSLVSAGVERQVQVVTEVTFDKLDDALIAAYVASGEPHGKAGGYAIQGGAELFVSRLSGSHSAVVGLPLQQTANLLREAGLVPRPFADAIGATTEQARDV